MNPYSKLEEQRKRLVNGIREQEAQLNQLKASSTELTPVLENLATLHIELSMLPEES